MDFNNGLYVFNGVPGLEASKGERIAKALETLQTKIKRLEQVRNSEREISSKSGSSDTEDITLSDVKLKLLFLQLQYMRVRLRRTRNDETKDTAIESECPHELTETEYGEIQNCKETQTGMSLHGDMPSTMPRTATSHLEETNTCSTSEPTVTTKKAAATTSNTDAVNSQVLPSEIVPPSSKDFPSHYHLKIDDVPFILGASAFVSHNLIATVQNLIAKMKMHNKSLCGTRFQASQNRTNLLVEKGYPQEIKRMMQNISQSLIEIQINQTELIEKLDKQSSSHPKDNLVKASPCYKKVNQKQTKKPSNTASTTTGATATIRLKENRQLKSARAIKKTKHVVPTNKIQTNLPQVARQRLLRTIREARLHLSEDDMSWV